MPAGATSTRPLLVSFMDYLIVEMVVIKRYAQLNVGGTSTNCIAIHAQSMTNFISFANCMPTKVHYYVAVIVRAFQSLQLAVSLIALWKTARQPCSLKT